MATVKNFNLAGVSDNVQFGKAGGKIDFSGGAFTVTDSGGTPVALTAATPAAANDSTLVATTAFVATELANFDDTRIVSADTFSSVVAGDSGAVTIDADDNASGGSLVVTVGTVGQYTVTNGKFDISESAGVQLSAANGTEAAPAIAFDAAAGEEAGLFFDPLGSPGSDDQVGMSVDGVAVQKWRVEDTATGTDYLAMEAGDGQTRIVAEGTTSDIDIRLVPKGVGQVYLGDSGSAASISSSDAEAASGFAGEDLSINAGNGDGVGNGGNIFLAPGADGGSGTDGVIELRDSADNAIMTFNGVATAVNYFDATNAAAAGNLKLEASGTDTDIDIELFAKGSGEILVQTGYAATVDLALITKGEVDSLLSGGANRIENDATTTFFDTELVADTASITSVADIDMNSGANITMDGVNLDASMSGTVDIDGTSISLGGTAASDFTVAGTLDLATSGANALGVAAPGATLALSGADVNADATAGISLDAATASNFTTAAGNLALSAADTLDLDGSTSITMDSVLLDVNMTGAIQLDAAAASNFTTSAGAITVDSAAALNLTASSGDVVFSASGDIDMGSNVVKNVATPTTGTDAVNRDYVDAVASGLDVKNSVRAATIVLGTLSTAFHNGETIDGVSLVTGDRILIKDQADASENGFYTVNAAGVPTRSTDADNSPDAEFTTGAFTFVEEGSLATTGWVSNSVMTGTTGGIPTYDLGTDDIDFTQFSAAGTTTVSANGTSNMTVNQVGVDFAIAALTDGSTISGTNGAGNGELAVYGGLAGQFLEGAGATADAAWAYLGELRGSTDGSIAMQATDVSSAVNYMEVTASATAGGVVTLSALGTDTDIDIALTPKGAGVIDATSNLISNVTDPVSAQDAATMNYVDTSIAAISTTSIENGTSNVSIVSSNGDVTIDVAGTTVVTVGSVMDVDLVITASDGSAAAPAYTFDTETDDGLYYTTNGGIAVSDSGTEAMELGLTGGHASLTALGTNINVALIPTGTGFIDASTSLISNVTDPVGDQDAATKAYVDTAVTSSSENDVRTLKETVSFIGATANQAFADTIPAGATITRISLSVTTIADATVTFTVGDGTTLDRYMVTTENDPEGAGLYIVDLQDEDGSAITPSYTVSAGSGAGVATIMVEYRSA